MKKSLVGNSNKYPGDNYYYIICDICGKKVRRKDAYRSGTSINSAQNLLVCKKDLDILNPQDLVKAKADRIALPGNEARPEGIDQFLQRDITWRDL